MVHYRCNNCNVLTRRLYIRKQWVIKVDKVNNKINKKQVWIPIGYICPNCNYIDVKNINIPFVVKHGNIKLKNIGMFHNINY